MICLKCGKEYEGNFSITGNNLCSVCDAVMVHMDGPMREVEKRYTPSAISVIRELETNLAAAQATIEKQRKVMRMLAMMVDSETDCGDVCTSYCKRGYTLTTCPGEMSCTDQIIAYAEKQVEEGR